MNRVSIGRHCCAQSTHLESFRGLIAGEMLEEVRTLARELKGVRICNINSTAAGGGVAEHIPYLCVCRADCFSRR